MTQEDRELLLKDLCARLPYSVKVSVSGVDFDNYQYPYLLTAISKFGQDILCKVYSPIYITLGCPIIENVKPYLRPMSSMTKEEKIRYKSLCKSRLVTGNIYEKIDTVKSIDWLNAHHFDYRDLIEKGLALEATEKMYNEV